NERCHRYAVWLPPHLDHRSSSRQGDQVRRGQGGREGSVRRTAARCHLRPVSAALQNRRESPAEALILYLLSAEPQATAWRGRLRLFAKPISSRNSHAIRSLADCVELLQSI